MMIFNMMGKLQISMTNNLM